MKRILCLLLALLMLAALLTGCGPTADPAASTSPRETEAGPATEGSKEAETPGTEALPPETEARPSDTEAPPDAPVDTDEPFDAERCLQDLVRAHPDAGPEALCDLLREDPYFILFNAESTEYYYPGLNYEYSPEGIREAACIVDFISGSGAVIYAILPEEGTDADALARTLLENAQPDWMNFDRPLDQVRSFVIDGKVFLAMYRGDMQPLDGDIAEKPRDFVDLFRAYLEEHPQTGCLDLAEYFASHQKLCAMDVNAVEEGPLTGFFSFEDEVPKEITGFAEGAVFAPQISPSTFIGYVFRLEDGADRDAFADMLRENANLAWNVCVAADTIIIETEGNLVLFMMCTEGTP